MGKSEPMLGRAVEIRSNGGIVYRGVVRAVRDAGVFGDLFELTSADDPSYRRLVFVNDRRAQIRFHPLD